VQYIDSAYEHYCRERFPLPSEEDISSLEDRLRAELPADFKDFLLHYNGGVFNDTKIQPPYLETPTRHLTYLRGIGAKPDSLEIGRRRDVLIFDDNDPLQILPIGGTAEGDLILLVTHEEDCGAILLRTPRESFYLAPDISGFFGLLNA
jgi:hypothetical protein